jgi:hypothetical protein
MLTFHDRRKRTPLKILLAETLMTPAPSEVTYKTMVGSAYTRKVSNVGHEHTTAASDRGTGYQY